MCSDLLSDGNESQSIIAWYRKVRFIILGLGSRKLLDTENVVLYMWDEFNLTGLKELYTFCGSWLVRVLKNI